MDIIKLFQGGFPMTIETLSFMQNAYTKPLSALSKMAGENSILDGIQNIGSGITEGFFVRNKEVLYFKASAIGTTVLVVEKTIQVPYNEDANADGNLDLKDAYVSRYATTNPSPAADEVLVYSFNFSELVRITNFRNLTPIGSAVLWFDPLNIPLGYRIMDGTGGTVNGAPAIDLRDMFIKMAGAEELVNTVSGLPYRTISVQNLPSHVHGTATHTHGYKDIYHSEFGGQVGVPSNRGSGDTDGDNSGFQIQRTTDSGGGGNTGNGNFQNTAINIEPRHYNALWIQFIGL